MSPTPGAAERIALNPETNHCHPQGLEIEDQKQEHANNKTAILPLSAEATINATREFPNLRCDAGADDLDGVRTKRSFGDRGRSGLR
jgi:hypothetical protein